MIKLIIKFVIKKPMKTVLVALGLIGISLFGAQFIDLATGNDTLVQTHTDEYLDNEYYMEHFGGDPVLILFEIDDEDTLSLYRTMYLIEEAVINHDDVRSINSNASLVRHMLSIQETQFKDAIYLLGDSLIMMSDSLLENSSMFDVFNEEMLLTMEDELLVGLQNMLDAQGGLHNGVEGLAENTSQLSLNIDAIIDYLTMQDSESLTEPIQGLTQVSIALMQMEEALYTLNTIPDQTITGLTMMINNLGSFMNDIGSMAASANAFQEDFSQLANGLYEMGSTLKMIYNHSDAYQSTFPASQATLDNFLYDQGELRSMFEPLMIDEDYMLLSIVFHGNASDENKDYIIEAVRGVIHDNYSENYIISGKPVLDLAIKQSMMDSMQIMLLISVLIMVAVLFFTFRVQWRLLPLVTILLAVLATLGLMGWLSVPVTMVSMAVFPILIGLGIDYAIQFQSRYEEFVEEVSL